MLKAYVMEFTGSWDDHLSLIEFIYNNSYHSNIDMAPYEAMYGRRRGTLVYWDEAGESRLLGPKIVQYTTDQVKIIRAKLKVAQDRQKSYAERRHKDVHFEVGNQVFLKMSPWKGIMRFGKKGKLSPRYIGPYVILERVRELAYKLALPSELSAIHNVFHIYMLRKYVPDSSHVIQPEQI